MLALTLVYISLSGNTESFVTRLKTYLEAQRKMTVPLVRVKELVREEEEYFTVETPFVAFLPTYLEGGDGVHSGDKEILTTPLGDFIAYRDNRKRCLGIVGSGNRNFNHQYCLTAKQYSERFGFPVIDTYELRGLTADVERIGDKILDLVENKW